MDDCYYFLYSSCKLEGKCMYRHNESCRNNPMTCRNWKAKKSCRVDCPFRHSEYHLKKNRDEEMCYWETKPSGCTKVRCAYRHMDPTKDSWKQTSFRSLDEAQNGKTQVTGTPVEGTGLADYEEVAELQSLEDIPSVAEAEMGVFDKLGAKENFKEMVGSEVPKRSEEQRELGIDNVNYDDFEKVKPLGPLTMPEPNRVEYASADMGKKGMSSEITKSPFKPKLSEKQDKKAMESDFKVKDNEKPVHAQEKADVKSPKSNMKHPSKDSPPKIKNKEKSDTKLDSRYDGKIKRAKASFERASRMNGLRDIDLEDLDKEIEELDSILGN